MKKLSLFFFAALLAVTSYAAEDFTFDFNAMDVAVSSNDATDGDITEALTLEQGDVTLVVSPKAEDAKTENRFWGTKNGPQLRVYSGTLTFSVGEGSAITGMVFNNAKWNSGNTADSGEFDANVWTGNAQTVVVTIAGNTQLNNIVVTVGDGSEEPVEADELVVLPEGCEPETYTLTASGASYGQTGWQSLTVEQEVQVAFYGSDVYLSGLSYYFPEAFVKGTMDADGLVTFKTGQFIGEDEYGKEYLLGLYENEESEAIDIVDYVFAFDAETRSLTLTGDAFVGESDQKNEPYLYTYLEEAVFTAGGIVLPDLVELPEGVELQTWYIAASSNQNKLKGEKLGVAIDGDDIYVQGLCQYLPDALVKGTINREDGTATFATGQFYGRYAEQYNLFFVGYDSQTGELCDVDFNFDEEAGTLTTDKFIILNGKTDELAMYAYYYDVVISRDMPDIEQPVEAPEDLEASEYSLTATSLNYEENEETGEESVTEEPYESAVMVGFSGQEVYIQGLCSLLPSAWVKGTLSADGKSVTLPAKQYLGEYTYFDWSTWSEATEDLYFTGIDFDASAYTDVVLSYDAEKGQFATAQDVMIIQNEGYYYTWLNNIVISKVVEFAATPATPEVLQFNYFNDYNYGRVAYNVPATDVNGEPMVKSLLSYRLLVETENGVETLTLKTDAYERLSEDMTDIPYDFSDGYDIYTDRTYLNFPFDEVATWKKIGVQSKYMGKGEEHLSEIGWLDLADYWLTQGISSVDAAAKTAVVFDLQGRRVAQPQHGLYIVNGRKMFVK